MTSSKPSAPADLRDRGSRFWLTSTAAYEMSDTESELLLECCRLLDECESLRAAVASDGTTVLGSTGQPRVHPAITELRQHRLALAKILSQLALPDDADASLKSPLQARSARASQARWGDVRAAKAPRPVEAPDGAA